MAGKVELGQDPLAESLNDLLTSVSSMVKGQLQLVNGRLIEMICTIVGDVDNALSHRYETCFGTNNLLELLEKMNLRVAEEYKGFGDVASGLRVYVEQLKAKSGSFDEYVQQIDAIDQQVTEFEAVISMLDKYVSLLESKVQSAYHNLPT
ncbi:biogenesis of lysosome-related organelles complex 1 subunit 2 isoform X1 [Cinnamomum micranthum f. kanehirae]|uniref:Biogenesis of lysosome-related organelles complex 1 subunit 2 isoform X1 n=1 Tax=Cinnamomum micranthum f. kanehirae TaxID=337451 RepID=A0A3S4P2Y0_9MAGN|nr:biogenesis of lysosome-related organelles complex 1 subunit 2 isoform X1 [Cinnamomum micranthum f. kanehirae]